MLKFLPILFVFILKSHEINAIEIDFEGEKKFYSRKTLGKENLVVIQTVTSSGQSFVIRKGRKHGVSNHQLALFSTDKISILCRAIEVSRDHSLWRVEDKRAITPFRKRQFVVFNNSPDSLFDQIPSLKKRLELEIKRRLRKFKPYWVIRGSGSYGIYESVSEIKSGRNSTRLGSQLSLLWYHNLMKQIDWGVGMRGDAEVASLKDNPKLIIPSIRYFFIGELIYHFPFLRTSKSHFYGGLALGIGPSFTEISDAISVGYSAALPIMRLGIYTKLSRNRAFLVEGVAEGVAMRERFQDGTSQTSNIANLKISIGLKF